MRSFAGRTRLARVGYAPDELATVRLLGVAAGDVVQVADDGRFEVLDRGGNVAVQLYTQQPRTEVERLLDEVGHNGGWLDGYHEGRAARSDAQLRVHLDLEGRWRLALPAP